MIMKANHLFTLTLSLLAINGGIRAAGSVPATPNFVVIIADDLGYADVGCFGAKGFKTPNLDRMAKEGMKFTSFYVSQAVCTASRASLMTGCYANRVGLFGALNHTSPEGINPGETLIPELLKTRGYATAIFGKWHLGSRSEFNPLRHGFDEFLGIPYSNDNSKYHPSVKDMPPLPLYEGTRVVELDPDQSQFTRRFTERAVSFIARNKERPFFLYVPHVMPHVPIFASEKFKGRAALGLYGDVIEELDWSVGEILRALVQNGLDRRTLVLFASDNGPFLSYGSHAGSATPLREGKLTSFEGGVRVPCIMRWPGKIPAARDCDEPVALMDLLPTFAGLTGTRLPDVKLDGRDIASLLKGVPNAKSPHESLVFYAGDELQAIRSGDWKLHFAHPYLTVAAEPGHDGKPSNWGRLAPDSITRSGVEGIASRHGYRVENIGLSLYNLREDPAESRNLTALHPEVVARLQGLAVPFRTELGDALTGIKGNAIRPAGHFETPDGQ